MIFYPLLLELLSDPLFGLLDCPISLTWYATLALLASNALTGWDASASLFAILSMQWFCQTIMCSMQEKSVRIISAGFGNQTCSVISFWCALTVPLEVLYCDVSFL